MAWRLSLAGEVGVVLGLVGLRVVCGGVVVVLLLHGGVRV